jgi:hypothetical protein
MPFALFTAADERRVHADGVRDGAEPFPADLPALFP